MGKIRKFASKLHCWSHLKYNVEHGFSLCPEDRSSVVHPAISAQSGYGLVSSSLIKSLPAELEVSLLAKGLFLAEVKHIWCTAYNYGIVHTLLRLAREQLFLIFQA